MFDDWRLSERVGEWESSVSWNSPSRPRRQSTSEPPLPRHLWDRAGWRVAARPPEPSDGLVVLPQPGLQTLVGQVVSGDDPNDLGQGEKDPVTCRANPPGQGREQTRLAPCVTVSRGDRSPTRSAPCQTRQAGHAAHFEATQFPDDKEIDR